MSYMGGYPIAKRVILSGKLKSSIMTLLIANMSCRNCVHLVEFHGSKNTLPGYALTALKPLSDYYA